MSWKPHAAVSWTSVANSDGDVGLQSQVPWDIDSAYHGASGSPSGKGSRPGLVSEHSGGYEMAERGSPSTSAPFLRYKDTSRRRYARTQAALIDFCDAVLGRGRHQATGWKKGVRACGATAATVCLVNFIVTIWAVSNHEMSGGISYLYTGSCTTVSHMSLWLHLLINVLSTLLLSVSNYTMQVLSSPTRREIDAAHAKSRWLDVGVPSMRNLHVISWGRRCMWIVLGLSSVPLHLLYNTAVFSSLSANEYSYFVGTQDFFNDSITYDLNHTTQLSSTYVDASMLDTLHTAYLHGELINMTASQCMDAYGRNFVSQYNNVLLVTRDPDGKSTSGAMNNSLLSLGAFSVEDDITYWWLCGDGWSNDPYKLGLGASKVCTVSAAKAGEGEWDLGGHTISYCMVQEADEQCRLSFSLAIMLIVISANLAKACTMFLTVWLLQEPTLVTIGDAIASFLSHPDPTTHGKCLGTKMDFGSRKWSRRPAMPWQPIRRFWFGAASLRRWLICNFLCIFFIGLGAGLLKQGMRTIGISNISELYGIGFGVVNQLSTISTAPKGLISATLFANLPQAILSFLYLTFNGLFTSMLVAYEWSLFSHAHRRLRVTYPIGEQRSTYYLQLPYLYAIPLLILSGALHWLMSQSLFLSRVTFFDPSGNVSIADSISTVGYSCIAIFCALIVGSAAVLAGFLMGFRRYAPGIPLGGSCSAAISAACHGPPGDERAWEKPVMWGEVEEEGERGGDMGHCAFSSLEVRRPVDGHWYAGLRVRRK